MIIQPAEWLNRVDEEILEPDRRIIDPHHHIYDLDNRRYLLADFMADIGSGHRVERTVYVQCRQQYLSSGPDHLKPVGESAFVARLARDSERGGNGRGCIAGVVAHADLRLGARLDEVLDAHKAAADGLLRGIRQCAAHDPDPALAWIGGQVDTHLYRDPDFIEGLRTLGRHGLSFDAWHFHHQLKDFIEVVGQAPDTRFVLNHLGTPLGVGPYAQRRADVFNEWRRDIADLSWHKNVYVKLGGMAMPANGYGWHLRDRPASSDELVAAHRDYYLRAIDCFGPERCMFESNFPVDRQSASYAVLWNAFKKLAAPFSEDEKHSLFWGTAMNVYRL